MKCTHIRAYGYNRDFFDYLARTWYYRNYRSTEDETTAQITKAAIGEEEKTLYLRSGAECPTATPLLLLPSSIS
jgi:hypothetical protein